MIEEYSYDGFGAPTVYNGVGNLGQNGTIYNNRFLFTGREENRNRGQSINLDRLGRGRVGHGTNVRTRRRVGVVSCCIWITVRGRKEFGLA
jgi:hypothetical protein